MIVIIRRIFPIIFLCLFIFLGLNIFKKVNRLSTNDYKKIRHNSPTHDVLIDENLPNADVSHPNSHKYEVVSKRNIFNSEPLIEQPITTEQPTEFIPPVKTVPPLNAKLIGTIVYPKKSQSIAMILLSGKTTPHRIGDSLDEYSTIKSIIRNAVIIERDGEEITLKANPHPTRRQQSSPTYNPSPVEIQTNSLEKSKMQDFVDNGQIYDDIVSLLPQMESGTVTGFKVMDIASDSILSSLKLNTGDILIKFGDTDISNIEDVIQFLQNIPQKDTFTIDITRGGKSIPLSYEVK